MLTESEEGIQIFNTQCAMLEERQFTGIDLEMLPFDLSVINDPQYTAVYTNEIFDFLRTQEVHNFSISCRTSTRSMRSI
jgi:hypothetical protein